MFARMNLGQKLTAVLIGVLVSTFLAGGLILERSSSKLVRQSAESSATAINKTLVDMVDVFITQVERGADRLMSAFELSIPEPFHLDAASSVPVAGRDTVALRVGGKAINADFALVDRFTKATGGVATIFVKHGDDFVRISTSLRKEDGARALGTALDHAHPAYARVLRGETYVGPARLFGRDYFTKYSPIRENGSVIGILFIGADFTDELKALREKIKSTRVGESGYAYVLDAREGEQLGTLVVHPDKEGQSLLDATDADGRPFVREMLARKEGLATYPWKGANESSARDKVVAYGHNPMLQWTIASGAYVDDLGRAVKVLMYWVGGLGLALTVLLPLMIHLAVRRLVTRPLSELQAFCQNVEASRDFTLTPPRTGNDEVGRTCSAVSSLMETLRRTFGGLMENVLEVDQAAHELNRSSSAASSQSDQASDSASSMAAAVEEMTVSINHISDNATVASDLAKVAGSKSTEGGETILRATGEMTRIAEEVQTVSAVIDELGMESGKISSIIGVIKDVAEQTNLLALNAAIEAARAGESGRGFAVVADEVRKLAERTALSTGEISGMVASIQALSERATGIMNQTVGQVRQGADMARRAGDAITEIQANSSRVLEVVEEITLALGEQSSASHQIAIQTENVARVAEENTRAANTTAASAGRLERLGEAMRERVQQFKF